MIWMICSDASGCVGCYTRTKHNVPHERTSDCYSTCINNVTCRQMTDEEVVLYRLAGGRLVDGQ